MKVESEQFMRLERAYKHHLVLSLMLVQAYNAEREIPLCCSIFILEREINKYIYSNRLGLILVDYTRVLCSLTSSEVKSSEATTFLSNTPT